MNHKKIYRRKFCSKNETIDKEVFIRCIFFYLCYLITFFISLMLMSVTNAPASAYQGILLGGTIVTLKFMTILSFVNKIILIISSICFFLYPLLNEYIVFIYIMIFCTSISILLLTKSITSKLNKV